MASWCRACRAAAPTLSAAARAQRQRDVHFVGISVDKDVNTAKAIRSQWGLSFDVAHDDGRFANTYEISVLPTVIVIDAEGQVRHVTAGAPREAQLERYLKSVGAARL